MISLGQRGLDMTLFFANVVSEGYWLFCDSGEVPGGRVYNFVGVIGGKMTRLWS